MSEQTELIEWLLSQDLKRLMIYGSRTWIDRDYINTVVGSIAGSVGTIITGNARGADNYAALAFIENGGHPTYVPAQWKIHGKRAGPMRNQVMVAQLEVTCAVGFRLPLDKESRGTDSTTDLLRRRGIPHQVIYGGTTRTII